MLRNLYIKNISKRVAKNRFILTELFIFVMVALSYLSINWAFKGPTYLADEIGYLGKAVFLASYNADLSSSYHAGYPILISPIYMLFNDPFTAWKGVLVFNSLMWAGSFVLLFKLLKSLFPLMGLRKLLVPIILCSFYPAYVTMSGYSFATTAFVFVLLTALNLLLKSKLQPNIFLFVYSLAIGFLYWVHPTAVAIIAASSVALLIKLFLEKQYLRYLLPIATPVLMVVIYSIVVHPSITEAMTPDGFTEFSHYSAEKFTRASLRSEWFWVKFGLLSLGMISYALIASFGTIAYAWHYFINTLFTERLKRVFGDETAVLIFIITISIIISALIMSFVVAGSERRIRLDYWMYGRYIDHYLLPIFAIGILLKWRMIAAIATVFYLVLTGLALQTVVSMKNTHLENYVIINTQGVWFTEYMNGRNFLALYIVASLLIITLWFIAKNRKYLILLIIPILIINIANQMEWHIHTYAAYSKPTKFYDHIINLPTEGCIGLHYPDVDKNTHLKFERMRLYAYLLYSYEPKRISVDRWLDECGGLYLAYPEDVVGFQKKLEPIANDFSGLTVYRPIAD